jgi:hypothetical protein
LVAEHSDADLEVRSVNVAGPCGLCHCFVLKGDAICTDMVYFPVMKTVLMLLLLGVLAGCGGGDPEPEPVAPPKVNCEENPIICR